MACSAPLAASALVEVELDGMEVEDGGRIFQSLMVQSSELERRRSPRSTGPRTGWKSTLITGAVWPL